MYIFVLEPSSYFIVKGKPSIKKRYLTIMVKDWMAGLLTEYNSASLADYITC
jgi:hypothetical protein